jgi:hypothetical protein
LQVIVPIPSSLESTYLDKTLRTQEVIGANGLIIGGIGIIGLEKMIKMTTDHVSVLFLKWNYH